MRALFAIFILSFSQLTYAANWNLNDVSYLFPLPQTESELQQLISPAKNKLIPQNIYLKAPPMSATESAPSLYSATRAVAVRVDPCGIKEDSNACEPQVRIVWQVIRPGPSLHSYSTLDAGMHSFYRLRSFELKALLAGLWQLKMENLNASPSVDTHFLPLGVHPAFLNKTVRPHFQKTLTDLILKYCSNRNLIQLTVEQILPSFVPGESEPDSASSWIEFSGQVKKNEKWELISIPSLKSPPTGFPVTVQKIFNESQDKDLSGLLVTGAKFSLLPPQESRSAQAAPHASVVNRLDEVLSGRSWIASDSELIAGSFQVLRRFQNPHLTSTKNTDCTSCHLASPAEFYLNQLKPNFETHALTQAVRYVNPRPSEYNLKNTSVIARSSNIFRAFGYFRNLPAINQRVINESAESAEYLNLRIAMSVEAALSP